MSVLALTNVATYVDGYDFTGDTNHAALDLSVDVLDRTSFRSGGVKEVIGGLKTTKFDLAGYWQSATSGAVDPESFPALGVVDKPVTLCPVETETSTAYLFQGGKFGYTLGGKLGEIAPFNLACMGTNSFGTVRGQLGKAKGTVSATGALGSGLNLGAVSATQWMYATLHVFPTAGTTITVVVESAAASNFAGATTRATIGPLTTTGGTWLPRVAGAITDTWWRFRVTAVTGTFTVAGAIAVA